jgi:nicotinic acid mononucleotide adenylyltransferase
MMSITRAAFLLAVQRLKSSSTITLTRFSFVKYDLCRKSVGQYREWLIHQVDLAVCARPGAEGSKVSKTLTESGGKIHWVHLQPDTVSSTEIRSAIQAGVLEPGLIPMSVADFISAGFLYR